MTKRNSLFAALIAALASASGSPAIAADGEILITHAKALAGNITPGDAPGYPITLSKTGSYRLGGNLIPGAGKTGIEITGDFVTLDFGGFTLNGRNIVEDGIFGGSAKGARIENGSITNFKGYGVFSVGHMWIIENMVVTGSKNGVLLNARMGRVLHSTVSNNLDDGLTCTISCLVEGNIVSQNGRSGLTVKIGAARRNVIMHNASFGLVRTPWLGYGENTIEDNNNGGDQTLGGFKRLFPNACDPTPCP